jgi:hypothetical protein
MEVAMTTLLLASKWLASIEWFHGFLSVTNQLQALAYLRPSQQGKP